MVERDYLHLIPLPGDATAEGLGIYRHRMQHTRNPLYAWIALGYLARQHDLEGPEPFPLPPWIAGYVLPAATALQALALGLSASLPPGADDDATVEPAPKEALSQVTQALGLSSGGWNAFQSLMRDQAKIELLAGYEVLRAADLQDGAICDILVQDIGTDIRTLRRRLAEARALVGATPRPKASSV